MKMNEWLKIEDSVPECKKGDKGLTGYLTSDTVALLMVGGLAGTYLDYGRRLLTYTPNGEEVVSWIAQATYSQGSIEHLILGWYPIPQFEPHLAPVVRLQKALVGFEGIDEKTTKCEFINFDNEIIVRDLQVTLKEILQWLLGVHLQDAMPNLPAEDRELFLTGMTAADWSLLTSEEEE